MYTYISLVGQEMKFWPMACQNTVRVIASFLLCLIGKPEPEASQTHLGEIHALKEKLKKENDGLKDTKQQLRELQDRIKTEEEESKVQSSLLQGNVELRERIQADERQRLERENEAILKEKLDSLKLEIEQEKAEVKVRTCIQNVHV